MWDGDYLALEVPVIHGIFPLADFPLHGRQLVLQEAPHDGHVAAVHPVVVDGNGVFLREKFGITTGN